MNVKICCQNENEAKLMDYIVNIGILNSNKDDLVYLCNVEWNGKIDITYTIDHSTEKVGVSDA